MSTDPHAFLDQLEAVFTAVITKARRDESFARQLAEAVGDPDAFAAKARARRDWSVEAPDVDPAAVLAQQGEDGLRQVLTPHTRTALYALVKTRGLRPVGASKMTKLQLIEHIIGVAKGSSAVSSVFEY